MYSSSKFMFTTIEHLSYFKAHKALNNIICLSQNYKRILRNIELRGNYLNFGSLISRKLKALQKTRPALRYFTRNKLFFLRLESIRRIQKLK